MTTLEHRITEVLRRGRTCWGDVLMQLRHDASKHDLQDALAELQRRGFVRVARGALLARSWEIRCGHISGGNHVELTRGGLVVIGATS